MQAWRRRRCGRGSTGGQACGRVGHEPANGRQQPCLPAPPPLNRRTLHAATTCRQPPHNWQRTVGWRPTKNLHARLRHPLPATPARLPACLPRIHSTHSHLGLDGPLPSERSADASSASLRRSTSRSLCNSCSRTAGEQATALALARRCAGGLLCPRRLAPPLLHRPVCPIPQPARLACACRSPFSPSSIWFRLCSACAGEAAASCEQAGRARWLCTSWGGSFCPPHTTTAS